MKSEPDLDVLKECYEKVKHALERFFILLILNEPKHEQKPQYKELEIIFRSSIFYIEIASQTQDDKKVKKQKRLDDALENPNCVLDTNMKNAFKLNIKENVDYKTAFLGLQKVETKFFPVPFGQTEYTISYQTLLTSFNTP